MINPPNHYNTKIQAIEVIDDWSLDFRLGNVVKYIQRYNQKDGLNDLKKALNYLQDKINQMESYAK